jgi:hypothetical protein
MDSRGAWAALTSYAAGTLIRQNAAPAVGSERVFVQLSTVTQISGASEPTWVTTKGGSTTDATCTWWECTGQPGVNGDTTNAPTWTQNKNTTVTAGLIIYDSVSGALQIVTTGGTTGNGAQPTFSATAGTTTSDNTTTWTSLGAATNFTKWAAPFARLQSAAAANWMTAGNTAFVGDDHAETQSTAMTLAGPGPTNFSNPTLVYCVDHTASVPPGSANLKTTGSISATAVNITVNNSWYFNGIVFNVGSTGNVGLLSSSASARYDNCAINILGTSTSSEFSSGGNAVLTYLNNTTFSFGATGQGLRPTSGGIWYWRNTPSAVGGTIPANLFQSGAGGNSNGTVKVVMEGVDFSGLGSNTLYNSNQSNIQLLALNCKFSSNMAAIVANGGGALFDVLNSDSGTATYRQERHRFEADLTTSTSVVRTGGAVYFGTGVAWDIISAASSASWVGPFTCPPSWIANQTTAANVTVTIYGIWFGSALPTNAQIWHDVEYLGSASSPLASLGAGGVANTLVTASSWAADTSAWDGAASAWVSNHSYSTGAIVSGTSVGNAGRVFLCTTGGTSTNGAAPAAFASAVDGGSVTDNTAVWKAGWRFKMAVALTSPQPQLAGYLHTYVRVGLSSATFYVDPQPVLS